MLRPKAGNRFLVPDFVFFWPRFDNSTVFLSVTWLNTALIYLAGNLSSRISREVLQVSKQKNKLHKEQPRAFPLKHESQKTMECCVYRKLRYNYYNLIYMRVKKNATSPWTFAPNNWCKPQQSLTWRAPVAFHRSLFSHDSQKTPLRTIVMSGYFSAQNPLAVPNSPLTSGCFPSAGNELCHCYAWLCGFAWPRVFA